MVYTRAHHNYFNINLLGIQYNKVTQFNLNNIQGYITYIHFDHSYFNVYLSYKENINVLLQVNYYRSLINIKYTFSNQVNFHNDLMDREYMSFSLSRDYRLLLDKAYIFLILFHHYKFLLDSRYRTPLIFLHHIYYIFLQDISCIKLSL